MRKGQIKANEFIVTIFLVPLFLFSIWMVLRENGFNHDSMKPFINISIVWLVSICGGFIIQMVHLPPNLGMLAAGLVMTNTTSISIPERMSSTATSAGLAIILLRSVS